MAITQLALFTLVEEVFTDEQGSGLVQWMVLWDGTRHFLDCILL